MCRSKSYRCTLCGVSVLVDVSAEDLGAQQSAGVEVVYRGGVPLGLGRPLVARLVRVMVVVVRLVDGKDLTCVGSSHDEYVVEYLAPDGADDAFAVGVHPRPLRCALDHV